MLPAKCRIGPILPITLNYLPPKAEVALEQLTNSQLYTARVDDLGNMVQEEVTLRNHLVKGLGISSQLPILLLPQRTLPSSFPHIYKAS